MNDKLKKLSDTARALLAVGGNVATTISFGLRTC